jgi:hypothetical protein
MSAIKNISLFIPHVYGNYTIEMVCDVFNDMNIGLVKNVDFVPKMGSDGKSYNAAYIHFYSWHDNSVARNLQDRVLNPNKEARVMYDDPWYWIVLENKGKKRVPGQRKPTIDLDAFTIPEKHVAQYVDKEISQEEVDQAFEDMENEMEIDQAFEDMENEMETVRMMSEIESEIDMEDRHLISIDSRYVEMLEQEVQKYIDHFTDNYNYH